MMTESEKKEKIQLMIVGVVFTFCLQGVIGVVISAQTVSQNLITLSYWSALVIDLIAIGIIAVGGIFA